MATTRRMTAEERARREAAYGVWVERDLDFAVAAAALGMEEEELRRWAKVHRWFARREEAQAEQLSALRQAANRLEQLRPLIEGIDDSGQRLFVPSEMKLDAAVQGVGIVLDLGGEHAEATRALIRGEVFASAVVLAQFALGVDAAGRAIQIDPKEQTAARQELVRLGLATPTEVKTLTLTDLLARLKERLRERGFESEPQA